MEALAGRVNASVRHFSRVFTIEVGMTPARYVEHTRTAAARRLLESTDDPLDRIAAPLKVLAEHHELPVRPTHFDHAIVELIRPA